MHAGAFIAGRGAHVTAVLLDPGRAHPAGLAELRRTGERIHTSKKLFNVREGWQPGDDWLPERLLGERLPDGVSRGAGLPAQELRDMIRGYYEAREWDANGFVPLSKLHELDLLERSQNIDATR